MNNYWSILTSVLLTALLAQTVEQSRETAASGNLAITPALYTPGGQSGGAGQPARGLTVTFVQDLEDEGETPLGVDGATERAVESKLRRERVEIEPYKGPPIFLDEPPQPPPATIVEKSKTFTDNYEDGSVKIERQVTRYSDDRLVNDGTFKEYFPNGQIFVEGTYNEGVLDGDWKYWFENGQLNRAVTYKNGVPHGSWEVYREDGSLHSKRSFKDGLRHGEWIQYNEAGDNPLRKLTYEEGQPDGMWEEWYPSGLKKAEYQFVDGVRQGTATEWDEEGNKRAQAEYKDGKFHGQVIRWTSDGKKLVLTYEDGKLKSEAIE